MSLLQELDLCFFIPPEGLCVGSGWDYHRLPLSAHRLLRAEVRKGKLITSSHSLAMGWLSVIPNYIWDKTGLILFEWEAMKRDTEITTDGDLWVKRQTPHKPDEHSMWDFIFSQAPTRPALPLGPLVLPRFKCILLAEIWWRLSNNKAAGWVSVTEIRGHVYTAQILRHGWQLELRGYV